ncbi:MAG: antibiotic biosynthesis monooxygenase [Acidobacteria bacterium]|nr:MAG: antibiotic biosynthesis monooxygenase [Acidobacteriota bacterium]
MIARIWHGFATPENASKYEAMLKPDVLPGLDKVASYKGSYLLRGDHGQEVEFITVMLWESLDAIRAVAGENYAQAIVPEERRRVLSRWDERAQHYEVVQGPRK